MMCACVIYVQVILMSATIEVGSLAQYFASKTSRGPELAPVVSVQGRSYNVIDFCLDDIKHVGEVGTRDVQRTWERL